MADKRPNYSFFFVQKKTIYKIWSVVLQFTNLASDAAPETKLARDRKQHVFFSMFLGRFVFI